MLALTATACGGGGESTTPPVSVERSVLPTVTDSAITPYNPTVGLTTEEPHLAINPSSSVAAKGKLLFFIPGTQASPSKYSFILRGAAARGMHAVGLNYINLNTVGDLCGDSADVDCFWKERNEVIFGGGTPVPSQAPISVPDSIVNRLQKLLVHLNSNYPSEGWGQFLNTDSSVNWSRLIVAGHSQGGGHVGVLAKTFVLSRAVYFASPDDWVNSSDTPASWSSKPNVTPTSQQYGFGSDRDLLVPNPHAFAHWDKIGMTKPSTGAVLVESSNVPFDGGCDLAQRIFSAAIRSS